MSRNLPLFGLVAYASLLACLGVFHLPRPAGVALFGLHSMAGMMVFVRAALTWSVWVTLQFAPLGALLVAALQRHAALQARPLRVAVLSLATGVVASLVILAIRAGALPNPIALLLACIGLALGVWLCSSWQRGPRARYLIVPKLLAVCAALAMTALLLLWLALEGRPSVAERALPSSAEKRAIVELFRGNDPRKIPEGEVRTLRLPQQQLDQLVAWGAQVAVRAHTRLALRDGGFSMRLSLRAPKTQRWINMTCSSELAVSGGRVQVSNPTLRVGRVGVPSFLLALTARAVLAWAERNDDVRPLFAALHTLHVDAKATELTYARIDAPPGLAARLLWGEQLHGELELATQTQIDNLLTSVPNQPPGDARFVAAVRAAFALAHDRQVAGSAVLENRAALLALGVVLGHPKLLRAAGQRLDDARRSRVEALRDGTTLRGRGDLTRHFSVSAALTVVSAVAPSDSVGLLKEELDADGGSGFSFVDLLADRAGTTLAELATRDEQSALRIQTALHDLSSVEALLPSYEGLPEGIQDAELQARYGGVTGAPFQALAQDIERRLATLPLYQR